jgi:hypothetical protein
MSTQQEALLKERAVLKHRLAERDSQLRKTKALYEKLKTKETSAQHTAAIHHSLDQAFQVEQAMQENSPIAHGGQIPEFLRPAVPGSIRGGTMSQGVAACKCDMLRHLALDAHLYSHECHGSYSTASASSRIRCSFCRYTFNANSQSNDNAIRRYATIRDISQKHSSCTS